MRAKCGLWVVLAAAMAACAAAGPPRLPDTVTIEGPKQLEVHKLAEHKLSGDWESAIWEFEPAAAVDVRYAADGKSCLWVAPPGTYQLRATVVNFTAKKLSQAKQAVTIGPALPPGPDPGPAPDPTPPGKYQVMLFGQSDQLDNMTAAQQSLFSSLVFRDALATQGHTFLGAFDPDVTGKKGIPPGLAAWFDALKPSKPGDPAPTLPLIALAPVGGGPIKTYPLPADEAGVFALLIKPGGR